MNRVVVDDYTFRNGVRIPKGSVISADILGMQRDLDTYEGPMEFQPWRHLKLREETGSRKSDFIATAPEFASFGHGKHACPGRYIAVDQLKLILAHVVLNYDIKCEQDGVRPPDMHFGQAIIPSQNAKLWFRKRA